MGNAEPHNEVLSLFTALIRAMVDHPEAVQVDLVAQVNAPGVLKVQVAPGDMKRLVGLGGRTARALRLILRAIAAPQGLQYSLDLDHDGEA